MLPRMHHIKVIQPQISLGDMHGSSSSGFLVIFEFESNTLSLIENHQVQLRAAVCGPEIRLAITGDR